MKQHISIIDEYAHPLQRVLSPTRRRFLRHSALTSAGAIVASIARPSSLRALEPFVRERLTGLPTDDDRITNDPRVKAFLQRAVDAAVSDGASYVDVRLTHTRRRNIGHSEWILGGPGVVDEEEISVGVRALVRGYWGFAAGPVWSAEEGARLGKEAAAQAMANTLGKVREMSLAPVSVVKDGEWTMPIEIDPFTIHPSQIEDIQQGLQTYALNRPTVVTALTGTFFKCQDKALLSSDGMYLKQRTYFANATFRIACRILGREVEGQVGFLTGSGKGLEIFDEARIRDAIDPLIERMKFDLSLPVLPIDVGRYEAVLDAATVASALSASIGAATQLDRAIGFEANAGGTSYLNDPAEMLETYMVGSPLLTVSADRSTNGGIATVGWDDEGVKPIDTTLIDRGRLINFQTMRETGAWMASAKPGVVARSTGAAHAPVGLDAPLTHTANINMHPGPESQDFESLVRTVKSGICVRRGGASFDFQQLNGLMGGAFYSVRNGTVVARLANAGMLVRAPELWKGIKAIGGANSVQAFGSPQEKGEPPQQSGHTTSAVPILHDGLVCIDIKRRA